MTDTITIPRATVQQGLEALAIADNIALVGAAYTPKSIDRGLRKIRESATALRKALEQPEQEPVVNPFEDKSVVSAIRWAAGLIRNEYPAGHNGADSWLMNYADEGGESLRLRDYRNWKKVNGRWQPTPPAAQRKPLTDEQDRALCEAYCNDASDEYFKARPAMDFPEMRRIFYAGHRKAWINYEAAHGIKEQS